MFQFKRSQLGLEVNTLLRWRKEEWGPVYTPSAAVVCSKTWLPSCKGNRKKVQRKGVQNYFFPITLRLFCLFLYLFVALCVCVFLRFCFLFFLNFFFWIKGREKVFENLPLTMENGCKYSGNQNRSGARGGSLMHYFCSAAWPLPLAACRHMFWDRGVEGVSLSFSTKLSTQFRFAGSRPNVYSKALVWDHW